MSRVFSTEHRVTEVRAREKTAVWTRAGVASPVAVDARVLALFNDASVRAKLLGMPRFDLAEAWHAMRPAILRGLARSAAAPGPLEVHQRLIDGLDGVALLISSAMFLRTMADVEAHFEMSFKTIKVKLERPLDTATGERAWRAARATMTAADTLGSWEAAREYMHTRNFALGGATPADLVKTAEGERVVVNELHAQAEGGPL
jgi:putative toxin-antitoxin system antitoxin component (TIGR02293 family)